MPGKCLWRTKSYYYSTNNSCRRKWHNTPHFVPVEGVALLLSDRRVDRQTDEKSTTTVCRYSKAFINIHVQQQILKLKWQITTFLYNKCTNYFYLTSGTSTCVNFYFLAQCNPAAKKSTGKTMHTEKYVVRMYLALTKRYMYYSNLDCTKCGYGIVIA